MAIADILNALAAAAPAMLLSALAVTLGLQFLVAVWVRRLVDTQGLRITALEFFGINLATLFYGLFLPAGNVTGIVVRYFSLARREGAHAGIALALLVDRLVATTTLCLVGLGFWLAAAPLDSWPVMILMVASLAALVPVNAALFTGASMPGVRAAAAIWPAGCRRSSRHWARRCAAPVSCHRAPPQRADCFGRSTGLLLRHCWFGRLD